jgi:enterochelin esterase-like enzyme
MNSLILKTKTHLMLLSILTLLTLSIFNSIEVRADSIEEDCSSLSNFTPASGGTWSSTNGRCVLTKAITECDSPICNLLLHKSTVTGDYRLTVLGTAEASSSSWDDFMVVFGYKDAKNYYFANFNESNNSTSNGIFKVVDGNVTQITDFSKTTLPNNDLHEIEIRKEGNTIIVNRSGTELGKATNVSFASGQVGLGTFNNNASFDELIVTETNATPTPTVSPTPSVTPQPCSKDDAGTYKELTYYSKVMSRNITYGIYTPPCYGNSNTRYPVVYNLHGGGGSPGTQWKRTGDTIKKAVTSGAVKPLIYVYPDALGNTEYLDQSGDWRKPSTSLMTELIPFIDKNYRTIAKREGRAIDGFSMGGFGALHHAFKYPEVFSSVVTYGAALSLDRGDNHPRYWARKNADYIRANLPIRMVTGKTDKWRQGSLDLIKILKELNIKVTLVELNLGHETEQMYRQVGVDGIKFMQSYFKYE